MSLIEQFVRHPVKVAVGVILTCMFGLLAVNGMPKQLTPEVEIPTLTIETRWPGASPQEVESEIVQEQEEYLQSVEGVVKMTSESMQSMGRIVLEFAVGADIQEALTLTNIRLQQVREYPENVDRPVVTAANSANQFIAWFCLSERTPALEQLEAFAQKHPSCAAGVRRAAAADNSGLLAYRLEALEAEHPEVAELMPPKRDLTLLRKLAQDYIESRFENVEGVADSNVFGGREQELQIIVDAPSLASRELTIADVRQALQVRNVDTSAGDVWEGKRGWVVRTLGQFESVEEVRNAIVARRDDNPVYLRDVAEVRLGHKKPDGMVRRYGRSVININASRRTGANVLAVMEGLRKAANDLNAGVLKEHGLELRQVYDETEYIHAAIGVVDENIFEGVALTVIVLMLFLRSIRSTIVILFSIFVSIVGMFLMMFSMGRSLNVLSLAGIAFAVGMLVDNFIVVLENIYRHHQAGKSPVAATVAGAGEVWGAVLAATLANLAVFVPVLFVQDQAGQLFRDIALAASSALICSLLVALIVVPAAAGRILSQTGFLATVNAAALGLGEKIGLGGVARARCSHVMAMVLAPIDRLARGFVDAVVATNAWLQCGMLRQAIVVLTLIGASAGLSWWMLPKREYLPNGNRNLVVGMLFPPPGYNLDQVRKLGETIEKRMQPYWDVGNDEEAALLTDAPAIADFFFVARGRNLFLGLRARDPLRAAELVPKIREVTTDMPGVLVRVSQRSLFEQGLTAGRSIDVEVTGPEITRLIELAGSVMGSVMQKATVEANGAVVAPQAVPIPSLDMSSPEMHIHPKWEQAADLGMSAQELGYAVDALVDGAFAGEFFSGGDKIDITIMGRHAPEEGGGEFTGHTQDLAALSMATPAGKLISLGSVANIDYGSAPEQINRRRRQRTITVSVTPPLEMPLEAAMQIIRDEIVQPLEESGQLAGGYQINLSGTADKLKATWKVLSFNLGLAVAITYLLMAALFESWLYPFVILLSVPLGAVGGFAGLRLLNLFHLQSLDVMTMLGFIILVGTVVNNPILIVEQALVHIRDDGMSHRRAILESVRTRIRPIFMTAFIGLFGLLPLVISPGAGSELYRGMGSVLLGGLLVSTVFTLILVPTLFNLALESKSYMWRWLKRQGERAAPSDEAEPLSPEVSSRREEPADAAQV